MPFFLAISPIPFVPQRIATRNCIWLISPFACCMLRSTAVGFRLKVSGSTVWEYNPLLNNTPLEHPARSRERARTTDIRSIVFITGHLSVAVDNRGLPHVQAE